MANIFAKDRFNYDVLIGFRWPMVGAGGSRSARWPWTRLLFASAVHARDLGAFGAFSNLDGPSMALESTMAPPCGLVSPGQAARRRHGQRATATPLMRDAGTNGCGQTRESVDPQRLSPTTK